VSARRGVQAEVPGGDSTVVAQDVSPGIASTRQFPSLRHDVSVLDDSGVDEVEARLGRHKGSHGRKTVDQMGTNNKKPLPGGGTEPARF